MPIAFPNESPDYRAAREHLLTQEIALRRSLEAVASARRALPPGGPIPQDYVFDGLGPDGQLAKIKLSELFAPGKNSLVIYNFMFPRFSFDDRPTPTTGATAALSREEGPCPSCSSFLDQLDGTVRHFEAAGYNFAVIAKAPIDRILAFAKDRGWRNLRLLSAANNTFKSDYHAETSMGQMPILTVFQKDGDTIRHFWSSELMYAPADPGQDWRHAGTLEALWNLMDLTPEGRASTWHEQMQYDCCQSEKPACH